MTPRQLEVLKLKAVGLRDAEIGERLRISTKTVRAHLMNVRWTLNVPNTTRAVVVAILLGELDIRMLAFDEDAA